MSSGTSNRTIGRLISFDASDACEDFLNGHSSAGLAGPDTSHAARNMATDQALHESVDDSLVPCLRFYRWRQPTLSLGYFQKLADRQSHLQSKDAVCVRRASGGGAILHHHELTYSIAVPSQHRLPVTAEASSKSPDASGRGDAAGANLQLYANVHAAIAAALTDFGVRAVPFRKLKAGIAKKNQASGPDPFLCFQRRTDEDLIVSGYKVLGSAQRRGKRSLLQHGSLLLQVSGLAPQLPGLIDLGAKFAGYKDLSDALAQQISRAVGIDWRPDQMAQHESDRVAEITQQRFGCQDWIDRR